MGWLQRRRERIHDERAARAARTKGDVDSRFANHEAPLEPADGWTRTEDFHAEVAAHAVTRWKLRRAEANMLIVLAEWDQMVRAVRDLHTDSQAGVCPTCYRLAEVTDTDDGLVNWPCPTLLAVDPEAATSLPHCKGDS
jgi:hypothetical protein